MKLSTKALVLFIYYFSPGFATFKVFDVVFFFVVVVFFAIFII